MKALIYARVMPNNKQVAKSDKLDAQEKRCRELARKLNATVIRVFKDEGAINPSRYMRGIQSLLYYLKNQKEEFLVIADHPVRIGLTKEIQKGCKYLGLTLHDHIIVGAGTELSLRALGKL